MEKIYEKLKAMSEKNFLTLQWIVGILCGLICWVALRVSAFAEEGLVTYIMLGLFLIFIFGSRAIARKIERPLSKLSIGMAISLGVCIVIFALCVFVFSDRGLLEIIFDIPV